jgi:hypothetical protein
MYYIKCTSYTIRNVVNKMTAGLKFPWGLGLRIGIIAGFRFGGVQCVEQILYITLHFNERLELKVHQSKGAVFPWTKFRGLGTY